MKMEKLKSFLKKNYNMAQKGSIGITITQEFWKILNSQKEPGETFEDVIKRLIKEKKK